MTDDIVTRLRADGVYGPTDKTLPLSSEAADEIERLRETEQDLRMHLEQDASEIERLRAELADWQRTVRAMSANDNNPPKSTNTDIINQLSYYVFNEARMPAGFIRTIIEEIERLRVAGDALAERLRWWTDHTDEAYPDHRVLKTWEKTRRG